MIDDADELVDVHLLDLPVALMIAVQERSDDLGREFSHIVSTDLDAVPARLTSLSQHLQGRYGAFLRPLQQQLDEAADRGESSIDITLTVPRSVRGSIARLWALLTEADEYCRAGDLLTLAPTPDMLTLRQWYLTQFIDQIDGAEAVPFSKYVESPPTG